MTLNALMAGDHNDGDDSRLLSTQASETSWLRRREGALFGAEQLHIAPRPAAAGAPPTAGDRIVGLYPIGTQAPTTSPLSPVRLYSPLRIPLREEGSFSPSTFTARRAPPTYFQRDPPPGFSNMAAADEILADVWLRFSLPDCVGALADVPPSGVDL